MKAFYASIINKPARHEPDVDLPIVREVDAVTIRENYQRVGQQIAVMIKEEMKPIRGDPSKISTKGDTKKNH